MKKQKLLLLLVIILGFAQFAFSQGVTTSAMKGKVVDNTGEAVFMANVLVTHLPTGTQYGIITGEDGRFNIQNMKVGGPYEVRVTFIGFKEETQTNIFLQLNKTAEIALTLIQDVVTMDEVVIIYDKDDVMGSHRTGTMTNVNREQIAAMPTISRSQRDLTRMTPMSDGNSFGGRNNLYNNFSLDGSIFNNPFGLDYATPGGQSDAQPVSLDAIDQIQVSIAPFDVREGGFTGAGVNAVTKSGTNELHATAYYFFRNQEMIGDKVRGIEYENLDYSTKQYGFSIGGPIVKNKLFFFVNYEREERDQLAHGFVADNGSNSDNPNTTSVLESDIMAVQDHLRNYWNYEPGAYQGYNHETYNEKLLLKLDYNIAKGHNLSLRYNSLDAWKDILPHPEAVGGRGATSFRLPFENSSYRIFNKINSIVGELNSTFNNKFSNKLLFGYTKFEDSRTPFSEPFPVVDIWDSNGNVAITFGSEMFSTNNRLNQQVYQITDNLTYYMDNHTLTAGFNYERFKFENSFNLFYYPWATAFSTQGFLNNEFAYFTGLPSAQTGDLNQDVTNSQVQDYLWSSVDVAQFALYIQDEFQVNDKLNLTLGLRADIPIYYNNIENTPAVQEAAAFEGWVDENGSSIKINPANWPEAKILWSPRFGFNYDVNGDRSMQLRGGSGIFSGRIPFVWLGNQSSNAGMLPGYSFQINATSNDFKWPQVWKTTLAMDWKFAKGWIGTIEGLYAKDLNAVVHRNYNMLPPSGQLAGADNRAIFAGFNEQNIYSSTAGGVGFLDAGTIVLDNTDEGRQFSFTTKLGKKWESGLNINASYTYLNTKDYTSIPAEIAADAFQRNPVVGNPNDPMYSWSRYGLKHRIIASALYKIEYGRFATSFAMFYELAKGNRYSYVYAGDLNQDAIVNNDLLYVPLNESSIQFGTVDGNGVATPAADATAQWKALDKFINQDPYLSERRGQYAERNGATLPWFSQMDIRILQDIRINDGGKRKHVLQLSLDILNFGNLINSNWGVRQFARTYTPLTVTGIDSNNMPYFKFDTNLSESFVDDVSVNSKWQVQLGVRYSF